MQACRTCLKVLSSDTDFMSLDTADDCDTNLPSVRSKLLTCVPELALEVIQSAVICRTCFQALNVAYNFKSTCLQTEDRIIGYAHCHGMNSVNILDVVHQTEGLDCDDKAESSLLHPQITLTEGSSDIRPPLNLPSGPDFDVEVKMFQIPNYRVERYNDLKQFRCTECQKCFVRKDKLMLHMRIHTGEKPFTCTHCGRSFSRKDKMNNHERTHTGEKPFTCLFCQKSFSRKDRMNAHMRLQHSQAMTDLEITVVSKKAKGGGRTVMDGSLQGINYV